MLTETQKVAVDKLVGNGANVSQTAKRLGLTREYVQSHVNTLEEYNQHEDKTDDSEFLQIG